MLRTPKVVLPEKKSLAQTHHKEDGDKKEEPFPIASSVNQGKN
jgi:hypothetical protein